jgi:site-specific DNA-methyltransferase (adenine-specific)
LKEQNKIVLFDPLAGTANLLLTVANNLEKDVTPVGVDHNHESCQLALAMFDMLDYEEGLFFQDTFTFRNLVADAITTDFPFSKSIDGLYFPYEVLKFHHQNLRSGGYVAAVIPNDFFEVAGADEFKMIIKELYNIIGLVKLPDTMFKGLGKSILILQKNGVDVPKIEKVLLAEIPSFQDPSAVNSALIQINNWFQENSEHKRGA